MQVFPSEKQVIRMAMAISVIVLLLVSMAATGCAHQTTPKALACTAAVREALKGCVSKGAQTIVAEDGFSLLLPAACPGKELPARLVILTDSPSLAANAIAKGGKELGECVMGDLSRKLLVLDSPKSGMSAAN